MKKKLLFSIIASAFVMNGALAEDGHDSTDSNEAVFSAETNKLHLKKVHYVDANGNMTDTLYAAELELSKVNEDGSFEFKLNNTNLDQIDEHGCVFPQTWHAEMGHCMEQN